jgi:hypothetical protein
MKLSKCVYGVLVYNKSYGVGMIKGVTNKVSYSDANTRSQVEHAITLVEWSCGSCFGINPAHLKIYRDK